MDYKHKYIKYKSKYFELLKQKGGNGINNLLEIDHVMFPIYNNNDILKEIKEHYEKNDNYKVSIGSQQPTYKGVYLYSKNFYVEHISTIKGEYYWSNSLAIILDKKYWSYYKNHDSISEHFMTPKFGCGYFFVSPEYECTNKKISKSNYDKLTIYISHKLRKELENIGGMKWQLPEYIKVNKELCQSYDIIVKDKDNLVGPLFQSNVANI